MFNKGWLSIVEFGSNLLATVQDVEVWMTTEFTIPVLGMGTDTSWQIVGYVTLSVFGFLFGSGLIALLGFKFIKWIVDIVL